MRNRNLLLLVNNNINQQQLDEAVESLNKVLLQVERNDIFCRSHELVRRTGITGKAKAILKAVTSGALKPFYFLINKN